MLFGDFNMHFIADDDDLRNYRTEEVKNNKTLNKFIKKGKIIVGNSFDALNDGLCITNNADFILADSI